jgi:aminoglycoside 3-N-acetyltransferase
MTGPVQASEARQSRLSLATSLRALGVREGQVLLVHASLRRLGWIQGGAATVAAAIRDVIGTEGTLVVPTQTADNSTTSSAHRARISGMDPAEVARYRAAMPPFDPAVTPSTGMGQLAEQVRTMPGAVRSAHPQTSFAALGPMAGKLMDGHRLDCHHGESSPLARLYEIGAHILLLGVGYEVCTAFHLAEYRYRPNPPRQLYRCVVLDHGMAAWREFTDVRLDDHDFGLLGADLDQAGDVASGQVGDGYSRTLSLVGAVDFAVNWLRSHRPA